MRIGFNPNKDKPLEPNDYFHQVIIPVFIPNQEAYFKDSFKIFQYCLESLFKTSHPKTYFTIVNNGSCEEVVIYLNQLKVENKIQEIVQTTAIGKLNAVLKGISGHQFDLITITDADVLFLNNWQKASYELLEAFPKAAVVSPVPSSKTLKQFTYPLLMDTLLAKELQFTEVKNPEAMFKFAESIGNPYFYKEAHLKYYLTIAKGSSKAVVGAGHFVATYRGEIFNTSIESHTKFGLGGNSEQDFLDKPAAYQGCWRIATEDNFAYHMGNVIEPWMVAQLKEVTDESKKEVFKPVLRKLQYSKFWNAIKKKVLLRILMRKSIWIQFLRFKGLDKETAKRY